MLKKLLGINRLERNFKILGDSLNRSWEWINHFNKLNSMYEERLQRLEKSNLHLMEITRELINQLQKTEEPVPQVREQEVTAHVNQEVNLSDKDLYLLQLIYQYAAFNPEHAVDTNTLFNNLTYKITPRGLRKKLTSLVDNGLLKSAKKGNVRYWYLNTSALAKIKKALKEKE